MKKVFRVISFVIVALVLFFVGVPGGKVASQSPTTSVCIIGQPVSSDFPEVEVNFRVSDSNLRAVRNLGQDSITVEENQVIYPLTRFEENTRGIGLDVYFVSDLGKETNSSTRNGVITRFLDEFGVDGMDEITLILSGADDPLVGPTSSFADVKGALETFPNNGSEFDNVYAGIETALNIIRGRQGDCSRPSMVIVISGDSISRSLSQKTPVRDLAVETGTPVHFVHLYGDYSVGHFQEIAEASRGSYFQTTEAILPTTTLLDDSLFMKLAEQRSTYTVSYRTEDGSSGTRSLAVLLNGVPASSEQQRSSYVVDVQPAKVNISLPVEGAEIVRTAQAFLDPGFTWDSDTVPIEFTLEFPDSHVRVPSLIRVIGITSAGEKTIQEITETQYSRSAYQIIWDVATLVTEGSTPLGVRVEVTDELGLQSLASPINFTVKSVVPESVAKQTTAKIQQNLAVTQYLVYVLAGVILISIALIIIFWKKIKQAFSASGSIGKAIEVVRKTIVGGTGRRKNPIAKLEIVSPTTEVRSVFTEFIKLGRDPNVSDYTFYTLNSECSVSGEHAHLVRKRDGWKIIAVSGSGSPVFLDDNRISMHEETPIRDGQMVELGYQDLGSARFKFIEVEHSEKMEYNDDTEFKPARSIEEEESKYRKTQVLVVEGDEFIGSGETMVTRTVVDDGLMADDTGSDFDDFDALFEDLREK